MNVNKNCPVGLFLYLEDMWIYDKIISINLKYRMEIMKKILCVSILLSVFCGVTNVHAGTNDDITNACYATKKCGAKDSIKTMTAIPFTIGGAGLGSLGGLAVGSLTPWVAGPGVGWVLGGVAGGYGGYLAGSKLGGYLAKSYNANEYLYFGDGTCLECDTHQIGEHYECPNGTIASNGSYYYRCRTETFGDSWEEYKPLPCRNSPIQDTTVKGAMYEIKATVDKRVNTGVNVYSGDMCLYISCGDGVLDKKTNSCVPKNQIVDDCPYDKGTSLYQSCKLCSDAKKAGNSEGWDKNKKMCKCASGQTWSIERGKCIAGQDEAICPYTMDVALQEQCLKCESARKRGETARWTGTVCDCGADKHWDSVNGKCVSRGDGGDVIIPKERCVSLFAELKTLVETQCVTLQTQLNTLIQMCESGILKGEYFSQQVVEIQRKCDAEEQRNNNLAKQKLVDAGKKLDDLFAGFKVSKWKDAEGKFNTARLASDSIAGVVLGTTGGLITSSVMKKKQTEQGFEDLQCVVGGQPVAGWGDEFMVGIQ